MGTQKLADVAQLGYGHAGVLICYRLLLCVIVY